MSTHQSLVVQLGLHLLLAGCGMLLFARGLGLGWGAAFVAAFALIFSAGFTRRTTANMFITTFAWLPFSLHFLRGALLAETRRRRLRFTLAAGLVFGISLLAGSPHMALFTSITLVLYGVLVRVLGTEGSATYKPSYKLRQWGLRDTALGASVFVLGALHAAALLLPAAEFAGASGRIEVTRHVAHWSHDLRWLLGLFVDYTGDARPDGLWFDYRLAGLGTTLLALASLWHPRRREVLCFWLLFFVFLDCSLGPPLPFSQLQLWLAPYPLNDLSRALFWAAFPLAVLAAYGADAVAGAGAGAGRIAGRRRVAYLATMSLLGIAGLFELGRRLGDHAVPTVGAELLWAPMGLLAVLLAAPLLGREHRPTLTRAVAIVIPLLLLCEVAHWNRHWLPHLTAWQGRSAGADALLERAEPSLENRRGTVARPNTNLFRLRGVLNGYDPLYVARAHRTITGNKDYDPTVWGAEVWESGQRPNLFLKRYFWLARQWVAGPLPEPSTLFPSATTVFLPDLAGSGAGGEAYGETGAETGGMGGTGRETGSDAVASVPRIARRDLPSSAIALPELRRRFEADELERLDVTKPGAAGRGSRVVALDDAGCGGRHGSLIARIVGRGPAVLDTSFREGPGVGDGGGGGGGGGRKSGGLVSRAMPVRFDAGELDRRIEIPLPPYRDTEARLRLDAGDEALAARIEEVHIVCDAADEDPHIVPLWRRANSVGVEVRELDGPRILSFLDAHYPGWEARVDGERVALLRTNDAFKGVAVGPGTHEVRFDFRPGRVWAGALVSTASIGASVGALLLLGRRRTPTGVDEEADEGSDECSDEKDEQSGGGA